MGKVLILTWSLDIKMKPFTLKIVSANTEISGLKGSTVTSLVWFKIAELYNIQLQIYKNNISSV